MYIFVCLENFFAEFYLGWALCLLKNHKVQINPCCLIITKKQVKSRNNLSKITL